MSEPRPKVSVLMITYNHEKYIEQAVRSVMMQETDFEYELVIGEDCSTDRTREIVIALQKEFPDKIRLILHPQNVGMIPNFVSVYNACRGEYIALCEGDDYWTSPYKLQLQVDYMEVHPECPLCEHEVKVIHAGRNDLPEKVRRQNQDVSANLEGALYKGSHTHTSAIVFRRNGELPDYFQKLRASGDWGLLVWLLISGGEIGFIQNQNGPMSVYRKNEGGITFQQTEQRWLRMLDEVFIFINHFKQELPYQQRKRIFFPLLFQRHLVLIRIYTAESNLSGARHHSSRALFYALLTGQNRAKSLKLVVQSYFPKLHRILRSVKLYFGFSLLGI